MQSSNFNTKESRIHAEVGFFAPSSTTKRLFEECRNSTVGSLRQAKTEMTRQVLKSVPKTEKEVTKPDSSDNDDDEAKNSKRLHPDVVPFLPFSYQAGKPDRI